MFNKNVTFPSLVQLKWEWVKQQRARKLATVIMSPLGNHHCTHPLSLFAFAHV